MRIYNTLTRQKEVIDQDKQVITLYTCGPTVYDFAHIGNLRAFLFEDILRRTLELSGFAVKHVMNITDVGHLTSDADHGDDKLEKGAEREAKTVWEIADFYTEAFKHDTDLLNILPPNAYRNQTHGDTYARATDFIAEQQNMVEQLIGKGYAYQTEQAIYFDVTKLPDYGKLSGQKLADKEVAVRDEVVTDPDKRSPHDFAVWFFAIGHYANHTMQWPSPWGSGFPGWHLECSAIIHATLGDPIDIHTGGVDHIGTHHTNEMAQTEAAFGHELAKFWLHGEFILVDGVKMSKSKQNFYTLNDIAERGFSPIIYRMRVLQSHYRSELNFTWESMDAARNFLLRLYALADRQFQPIGGAVNGTQFMQGEELYQTFEADFRTALIDDLGTPEAVALIGKLIDNLDGEQFHVGFIEHFETLLALIDSVFALELTNRQDISDDQKSIIARREQARISRNWAESDHLRDTLLHHNIGISDTPQGPRWFRTTI